MTFVINGTSGATQSASFDSASTFGFKNRLINGAMMIDQRNAGASVTVNSSAQTFSVDRWWASGQSTDGVFTMQQSATAPSGFSNSVAITVTTADSSIGTTQRYYFAQRIEGFNTADLGWGAAGASTVTLSFWVRSSVTGTFGGFIYNSAADYTYPFSYTINSANTWEQKTVTIAGPTAGTWIGATNGVGMQIGWSLGTGTDKLATAGTWAAAQYFGATGQTNLIATNGATWYITGVQLEKGSTATSFDYRPYGTELQLCQRYCPVFVGGGSGVVTNFLGQAYSSTNVLAQIKLPVTTRVPPTGITATAGNFTVYGSTLTGVTCSSITYNNGDTDTAGIVFAIGSSSLTSGNASIIQQNNGATPRLIFTGCEL